MPKRRKRIFYLPKSGDSTVLETDPNYFGESGSEVNTPPISATFILIGELRCLADLHPFWFWRQLEIPTLDEQIIQPWIRGIYRLATVELKQ